MIRKKVRHISLLLMLIIVAGAVCYTLLQVYNKEQDTISVAGNNTIQNSSMETYNVEDKTEETTEESKSENIQMQTEETTKELKPEDIQTQKEALIEDFNVILQNPELPTGCEITAMTMIINYYGFSVDKMTMALEYMPTLPAEFHYGQDGVIYGNDMERYFIGDPRNKGYICGTTAIVTAVDDYLDYMKSNMRAIDISGSDVDKLYNLVSHNIPVLVYVTIGMRDRAKLQGWYTEAGDYMEWSVNDHGAVLIGYSEETVVIADPISGIVEYRREQFEKVFASRGNKCVILQ